MRFFKPKATVDEIVSAFARTMALTSDTEQSIAELAETCGISADVITMNFLPLQIFAVDYSASAVLNGKKVKYRILKLLYDSLFLDMEKVYLDIFKQQIHGYSEALNPPHPSGPAGIVGMKFCEYCDLYSDKPEEEKVGLDIRVMEFGSIHFVGTVKFVTDILKEFRIKG